MEITVRLTALLAYVLWAVAVVALAVDTLRPGGQTTVLTAWGLLAGLGATTATCATIAASCVKRLEVDLATDELATQLRRRGVQ